MFGNITLQTDVVELYVKKNQRSGYIHTVHRKTRNDKMMRGRWTKVHRTHISCSNSSFSYTLQEWQPWFFLNLRISSISVVSECWLYTLMCQQSRCPEMSNLMKYSTKNSWFVGVLHYFSLLQVCIYLWIHSIKLNIVLKSVYSASRSSGQIQA